MQITEKEIELMRSYYNNGASQSAIATIMTNKGFTLQNGKKIMQPNVSAFLKIGKPNYSPKKRKSVSPAKSSSNNDDFGIEEILKSNLSNDLKVKLLKVLVF